MDHGLGLKDFHVFLSLRPPFCRISLSSDPYLEQTVSMSIQRKNETNIFMPMKGPGATLYIETEILAGGTFLSSKTPRWNAEVTKDTTFNLS